MNKILENLTEADIRARCTEESFKRGRNYYSGGAIKKRFRHPALLETLVEGNETYRVWVWVDANNRVKTRCTCPYQMGGECKHIVATLLAWLKEPESFRPPVDVKAVLRGRSHDELVNLLMDVFSIYPDLVDDLDVVGGSSPDKLEMAVDQVFEAMGPGGYWTGDQGAPRLKIIARQAGQLAGLGQLDLARRVYYKMVTGVLRLANDYYGHGNSFFSSGIEAELAAGYAEIALQQIDQHRAVIEAEARQINQGEFTADILDSALFDLEEALGWWVEVDRE